MDSMLNKQLNTAFRRYNELMETLHVAIDEETADQLLEQIDEQGAEIDLLLRQASTKRIAEAVY